MMLTLQPLNISSVPIDDECGVLANPPTSAVEQFRHWITDVEISPVDADPNCKFSVRIFVDHELVCNLPWIGYTRSLRWSGLLLCDVSPLSKVSLRLCRSFQDKPRYFNFPASIVSEVDEETGEITFELPEAAWVVTIKSLTVATAEQHFPGELDRFNAIDTLPECTAKVSFLICMKAWKFLDQQTRLDDMVQAILRGLTRVRDILDVVGQASSSMLAAGICRSKEPINGILALLEDASVYIYNRYTTNYLANIFDDAGSNNMFDLEAYLDRLDGLQRAFYASWSPTGASSPATAYLMDNEPLTPGYSIKTIAVDPLKADWQEVLDLLKPTNPSGYDLDRACLHGTREAGLNKVLTWTQNHESSDSFMWISGQAGMGKTAIATSLCQRLDSIRALAGSFLCRRDDPGSSDPLTLINNLACEMAMNCPTYAHEVFNAIRLPSYLKYISMPTTLVVIVDGLDECGDQDARGTALLKLYEMSRLVPWLKVIVTSRPLGDLQTNFEANCSHGTVVHLQDYDAAPDIRAYMQEQLGRLAETEKWPAGSIKQLCSMSQGVFLWATLATRYIKKAVFTALPKQKMLNNQTSLVTDYFDALYTRILETTIIDDDQETKDAYLRCIGSIVATSQRQSSIVPDLQYLLLVADQVDQLVLEQIIKNLAPLLVITDGHIRFLHASFKDHISNSSRSGSFHIPLDECRVDPAASCLKLMQRELRFNICQLESSHLLNSQVPDLKLRIQSHIRPTLKYACLHWIDHFICSLNQAKVEAITRFMEGPQLMYWIEVLSLLSRLDVAIEGLANLESLELVQYSGWSLIRPWVKDARRLILSFYDAIATSTPHLYISALAFAPSKSPTAHRMGAYFPNTVTIAKDPGLAWHPCVKTIAHPHSVQSLSMSPDGFTIVVGYDNGSLAIWDLQTGTRISESLVGHDDSVSCVVHSPNGNLIASGSYDSSIRVWDVADRLKSSHILAGHSGAVYAVAFSPDSTVIASGSSDHT
ncbi:putative vegetative incompatibility protein HET-E-1, partial [Rhizoctonia solani 123E]